MSNQDTTFGKIEKPSLVKNDSGFKQKKFLTEIAFLFFQTQDSVATKF